ncbi:FprA family A-type flavoprotein [Synergistaceae bacterium OttesenSCG-928-D05]|nr:FprA family A-type flavoprotein [Synergistaceae bacterium OttesenSCG-928-D05]
MQKAIAVTDSIYWIGGNDRETDLFEGLWALPRGVAYNAYLICDDKVALVDSIKSSNFSDYTDRLYSVIGDEKIIDYLIVDHMEPDHSGSIRMLRQIYPNLKIVGNKKTLEMIEAFYGITEGTIEVKEGDVLDLGHHKLTFAMIPMVHWPESMVTYDMTDKVLFSTDAFGGFSALEGGIFDDELDMNHFENETLRYFANIVGRYAAPTQKAIQKVRSLDLKIICPAHGPIHRANPCHIVDLYDKWSSHVTDEGVVVVYGSMYGNTKLMSDAIARSIAEQGIQDVIIHDVSRSNLSFIVRDVWKYTGLVLCSCTYNMELYPPMATLCRTLKNKMMKSRVLGLSGSYSWSKGALAELQVFAQQSGDWNLVGPAVEVKSAPTEEDILQCRELGKNVALAVKEKTKERQKNQQTA